MSGEITGSVPLYGRFKDTASEVSNKRISSIEVVGTIEVEVELPETGVGHCLRLVSKEVVRDVRVGGKHEDP